MTVEPPRVLWASIGLGPGGAERLLVSMAGQAPMKDFAIHAVYLLPWKQHLVGQLEDKGVRVWCLGVRTVADPRWMVRLRRLVRREQIDLVHFHSPMVAGIGRVALSGCRRPAVVTTEHNVWGSHRRWTRLINRATIGLDDHVFAVSAPVRDSMATGIRAHTEVLMHGVDVDDLRRRAPARPEARQRLGAGDDVLLVGTVANLRATKDYPTMLRAAAELQHDGRRIRFVSVGQGPLEGELRKLRDELGLAEVFDFLGYCEDPAEVLAACDLFCLSSRYEGLPIALLEALSLGLPVVATDVGGVGEVVTDQVEGLLVPPGSPSALARAIATLMSSERPLGMAAAARRRALDFDIARAAARQAAVYDGILRRMHSHPGEQ